ncbi:MAG: toll/interleukin-1 receptor domain-containing protein [Cellvibrionaceae bacterium]
MSGIFISYRRADASAVAYRLSDELQRIFGEQSLFLDVESIAPGLPFADAIQQSLNQCSVVLIIIGPEWIDAAHEEGGRRLDDENDWVRKEVNLALNSNVRVIPVLVQDAPMPTKEKLPDDIKGLADLHAFTISNSQTHWSFDVQRLVEKIAQIDKTLAKKINKKSDKSDTGYSHKAIWGLGLALLLVLAYIVDGWEDTDEIMGAIVLYGVALALGFFGFKDIQLGKTKGKGFAITAMAVSSLFLLLSFGHLAMYNDDVYPAQSAVPSIPSISPIQPAPPVPPVVESKPQPQPKKVSPPKVANIAGVWSTAEGVSYQVMQSGNQVSFVEYTVFGVPFGEGVGNIQGNTYYFNYYSAVSGISGQGVGSIQGNTISINFTDALNNTQVFDIYRQ